jgi:hypothetical protein
VNLAFHLVFCFLSSRWTGRPGPADLHEMIRDPAGRGMPQPDLRCACSGFIMRVAGPLGSARAQNEIGPAEQWADLAGIL